MYKSAFFLQIKLKFSLLVHIYGLYNISSGFYDKPTFLKQNQNSFFENLSNKCYNMHLNQTFFHIPYTEEVNVVYVSHFLLTNQAEIFNTSSS